MQFVRFPALIHSLLILPVQEHVGIVLPPPPSPNHNVSRDRPGLHALPPIGRPTPKPCWLLIWLWPSLARAAACRSPVNRVWHSSLPGRPAPTPSADPS